MPSPASSHLRAYIDPLLTVGLAIASGALLRRYPYEVVAAGLGTAWLLVASAGHEPRDRAARIVVMVAAALGLGLGWARAGAVVAAHEQVLAQIDDEAPGVQRCDGKARVITSPVFARQTLRWVGEVTEASCGDRTIRTRFAATFYDSAPEPGAALARGDDVEFIAQLGPPERLTNFDTADPVPNEVRRGAVRSGGLLDVRVLARGRGPLAWIDRARAKVRARIEATFPVDTAPMARAMVLGESDLTPDDDDAFRGSGLSHLLAVSGMHLVLVVLSLTKALHALLIRIEAVAARIDAARVANAIGIVVSFLYADFAGASGSALRAAWMTTAILLAGVLGRRGDGARALGLSIAGMALHDPLVAYDASFVLSVLATAGLFVLRPAIDAALSRVTHLPSKLVQPLAATLGATLACAPATLAFSPTLPLGGVVANLLAVPIGEVLSLPLCLVHAVLSPLPSVERGCATVASLALTAVRWIARTASQRATWLAIPVPPPTRAQLAVLAFALAAWVLTRAKPRRCAAILAVSAALVVGLELEARARGAPTGRLRVTFLDVGQGDAALIDLPNGEAMMVDAGGIVGSSVDVGARVIAPTLRARRRDALALVVLSHPHPDHFGGFATGLDAVAVRALWDTGQGEREGTGGGYAALLRLARDKGAAVQRPESLCGTHTVGGATVEVLAPCPGPTPDRGPNDNSLVLRLGYGARHILLTGDAEAEEEGDLLHAGSRALTADVLKIGHHGSRTSSSAAFVSAVKPAEAIVSVGARNRFGHPSAKVLATLERAKTRIWRTDRDGAIAVETDGRSLLVKAAVEAAAPAK
ncbi:DNA internalization-related competence protein ComEC/Rec2 [Pendulispora albinea]|uniref:DNA internalization-related competence protein ComEC/Rec2 n=1 Tax=Pendulispora albinea TaxID=2741071 RepID=A0ABZ2LZ29_9BACT